MTMCSGGGFNAMSSSIAGKKSSATVQQMQPLASSMIAPLFNPSSSHPSMPQLRRTSPSTPTSPNSLMSRASRRPFAVATRCRISVVFPAPRKPVTMVAGIFARVGTRLSLLSGSKERTRGGARLPQAV